MTATPASNPRKRVGSTSIARMLLGVLLAALIGLSTAPFPDQHAHTGHDDAIAMDSLDAGSRDAHATTGHSCHLQGNCFAAAMPTAADQVVPSMPPDRFEISPPTPAAGRLPRPDLKPPIG